MRNTSLAIFFVVAVFTSSAFGAQSSGWKFLPSAMFLYSSDQNGTTTVSTSRLMGEASLGMMFQNSPLYIGAIANYDSQGLSGGLNTKDTIISYGASIGMVTDSIYMLISYFASSTWEATSNTNILTTYSQGTGFQFTAGYLFNVSQSISMGPQFSYRSLSYAQQKIGSAPVTSANLTRNTLTPYLVFLISL